MKHNFNNEDTFAQLEDKAIDGQLDYDSFPPVEYKYFSRLAKLGYLNRHKGWSVEICEAKQREFKDIYKREKDEADRFLNLSKRIQINIMNSADYVRKMYKTKDREEIFGLALKTIENLTNENGFTKRISERLKNECKYAVGTDERRKNFESKNTR